MQRCSWVNLKNEKYIYYHDFVWGIPNHNDQELFEYLTLEIFQAGLTWETILNKQKYFKNAFDDFDIKKIKQYNEEKIEELLKDKNIIRNRRKILATINNAQIFSDIQDKYGSFDKYIWHFTSFKQKQYKKVHTDSALSRKIANDLKRKGMQFIGSKIIYSYLEAIGILDNHQECCFKRRDYV